MKKIMLFPEEAAGGNASIWDIKLISPAACYGLIAEFAD